MQATESTAGMGPARIPVAIVVLVAVGTLAMTFFGVAALIDPARLLPAGGELTVGGRSFADHMAVRNIAIVVVMVLALIRREARPLAYVLALLGIVQALDAGLGVAAGQILQIVAPAIMSLAFFGGAYHLVRRRT